MTLYTVCMYVYVSSPGFLQSCCSTQHPGLRQYVSLPQNLPWAKQHHQTNTCTIVQTIILQLIMSQCSKSSSLACVCRDGQCAQYSGVEFIIFTQIPQEMNGLKYSRFNLHIFQALFFGTFIYMAENIIPVSFCFMFSQLILCVPLAYTLRTLLRVPRLTDWLKESGAHTQTQRPYTCIHLTYHLNLIPSLFYFLTHKQQKKQYCAVPDTQIVSYKYPD